MDAAVTSPPETLSPDKERQILDGAAGVFAQDGYEGASMSRIAAVAGVSKGTLYNYFASKAELFMSYVKRDCTSNILMVFEDLDPEAPAEDTLRRIGLHIMRVLLSEPAITVHRMVISEAEKFPELSAAFYEAAPSRALRHIAAWIGQACAQGKLVVEDPDFAAEQLFALTQTQLIMKRRLYLIDSASQEEIDYVVDSAVKLFMRGYGPAYERQATPPGPSFARP